MIARGSHQPINVFDVSRQLQLPLDQVRELARAPIDPLTTFHGRDGVDWVPREQYDAWLRRRLVSRQLPIPRVPEFTRQEWLVLVAVAACPRYRDAAAVLGISIDSLKHTWRTVLAKYRELGDHVPTKLAAIDRAHRDGFIHLVEWPNGSEQPRRSTVADLALDRDDWTDRAATKQH